MLLLAPWMLLLLTTWMLLLLVPWVFLLGTVLVLVLVPRWHSPLATLCLPGKTRFCSDQAIPEICVAGWVWGKYFVSRASRRCRMAEKTFDEGGREWVPSGEAGSLLTGNNEWGGGGAVHWQQRWQTGAAGVWAELERIMEKRVQTVGGKCHWASGMRPAKIARGMHPANTPLRASLLQLAHLLQISRIASKWSSSGSKSKYPPVYCSWRASRQSTCRRTSRSSGRALPSSYGRP